MKKIGIILTAVVAILLSIYALKHTQGDTCPISDELVVGTNATFAPFCFIKDDKLAGIDIDLAEEIARRLHKKIVWKDLPFDVLILELLLGRIHMIAAGMTPTPERAQRVLFTTPHIGLDPFVIVSLAGRPFRSLAELEGQEVIVNDGFSAEVYMKTISGPILKQIPTVAEAMLALGSGRADAYVSAICAIRPFLDQNDRSNFVITSIEGQGDTYALGISKDCPDLFNNVERIIAEMVCDGSMAKLKGKWNFDDKF